MMKRDWPVSRLQHDLLHSAIGRFLRTHRDGARQLVEWMGTFPTDRTEAQFEEETRRATERKQAIEAALREAMAEGATAEEAMRTVATQFPVSVRDQERVQQAIESGTSVIDALLSP
jgi:hypothetical protein